MNQSKCLDKQKLLEIVEEAGKAFLIESLRNKKDKRFFLGATLTCESIIEIINEGYFDAKEKRK